MVGSRKVQDGSKFCLKKKKMVLNFLLKKNANCLKKKKTKNKKL